MILTMEKIDGFTKNSIWKYTDGIMVLVWKKIKFSLWSKWYLKFHNSNYIKITIIMIQQNNFTYCIYGNLYKLVFTVESIFQNRFLVTDGQR